MHRGVCERERRRVGVRERQRTASSNSDLPTLGSTPPGLSGADDKGGRACGPRQAPTGSGSAPGWVAPARIPQETEQRWPALTRPTPVGQAVPEAASALPPSCPCPGHRTWGDTLARQQERAGSSLLRLGRARPPKPHHLTCRPMISTPARAAFLGSQRPEPAEKRGPLEASDPRASPSGPTAAPPARGRSAAWGECSPGPQAGPLVRAAPEAG